MYGARLRNEFEARTGGTWPLNVGQVYTTLARLERDGLVEPLGGPDEEGRITYRLTAAGRGESTAWWTTPVARDEAPRDELVIKLALAVTVPGVDVTTVVQSQRTATMKHLRDLTRLKAGDTAARSEATRSALTGSEPTRSEPARSEPTRRGDHDLAWSLVLEHLLFAAEAEARWLDHVESRLARLAREARMPAGRHTSQVGSSAEQPFAATSSAPRGSQS